MSPQAIQIATELVASLLAARRQPMIRWPLLALAGIVALIGVVFLAISADLALAERMSPPAAAAVVGGGLVAIALILALIAHYYRAPPPRSVDLPIAAVTEFAAGLLDGFEGTVEASPKTSALAAFAAGCIVGCTPGLDRGLSGLFR